MKHTLTASLALLILSISASAQTPQSISIVGPTEINENSSAVYRAIVTYTNLTAGVATPVWTNQTAGTVTVSKTLKVVAPPVQGTGQILLSVSYNENGTTVQDQATINVVDAAISGDSGLPNAERSTQARPASVAGLSVDTATGAQMLEYELLPFQGGLPFHLGLSYNSAFKDKAGVFGPGWWHNYEMRITGDENDIMAIEWGPGFRSLFQFIEEVGDEKIYAPMDDSNRRDTLVKSNVWLLTKGDGTTYEFNTFNGNPFRVRNKVGDTVDVGSDKVRLVDASNEINFRYQENGLVDYIYDESDDGNGNVERHLDFDYDENGRLSQISQAFEFRGTRYAPTGSTLEFPDNDPNGATFTFMVDDRTDPIGMFRFSRGEILYQVPEDIIIKIISPQGTEVTMINNQDLSEYTDGGRVQLPEATGFTNAFEGENPFGEWKIVAIDNRPTPQFNPPRLSQVNFQFSDPTNPKKFTYDSNGRLLTVSDPIGRTLQTFYDSNGRVITQDDGVNTNLPARFAYQETSDGKIITTFTDRVGNNSVFEHDGRYNLLKWTDPLGGVIQFEYDVFGNRTSFKDQLGRKTSLQYDDENNLISGIDPLGRSVVFDYDDSRNVTFVLDSRGNQSSFGYDSNQNLDEVTDPVGQTTRKEFNSNSDLRKLILPDGAEVEFNINGGREAWNSHANDPNRKEFRTYDEVGRLTRIKDRQGYDTNFDWSPTSKKLFEEDPLNNGKRWAYDERDRLISETDKNDNETRYEYDGNDNLTRLIDALGNSIRYAYDGEDRLTRVTDENGNVTQYAYDAFGRTISETDALGNVTRFEYDAVGNQTASFDAKGNQIQSKTYTVLDQEATVTDARGNTITKEYDENGNLIRVIDPKGRRTSIAYDSLNRATSITDPLNRVARKIYNNDGTLARIENPGGSQTEYIYDNANRIKEIAYGDRFLTYNYDDWRDLITTAFDEGSRFDYEYDRVGRRTLATSNDNGNKGDITYEYDDQGNLIRVSDDGSFPQEILREYDSLNRVTSYTDVFGNEITYTYDAVGNTTAMGYPDGKTVNYSYDALNRVKRVTDWAGRQTEYTYDENDLVTRVDFPNGTYRTMEYNNAQRLIKRGDYQNNGMVIAEYEYSYDIVGQVESVIRADGFADPYVPQVATFTYDSNNVATSYNGTTLQSDLKGNLTKVPYHDGMMDVDYYGNNSIRWMSYNNGRAYDYDLEDRLVSISSQNGGPRFIVNPHAGLSQYIQKIDQDDSVTSYVYGIGLIYEENSDGDVVVYHYDDRGSTIAQSDQFGNVFKRYSYGPYGERVEKPTAEDSPFLFLGMFGVLTDENGLCYMRFRHYSPTLRRFVGPDAFPGDEFNINSLNKFAYGLGNPLAFNDPEGEFVNILVGAAAGAVGGLVAQGVSDLINGKKPNWKNYVAAAAGGAVTGALIGSGAGVIFAGAAGGFTEEFLNQGLNGGFTGETQFDVGQLALSTAIGGAAGALGSKGKRAVGITSKAAFRKQVVYNGLLYSSKSAVRKGVTRQVLKTIAIGAVGGAAGTLISEGASATGEFAMNKFKDFISSFVDVGKQSKSRFHQIRQYVQGNQRERSGAFDHFELYKGYMQLAGIPLPNSPNGDFNGF